LPWMLVGACYMTGEIYSELWMWALWPLFALTNDAVAVWLAKKRLRANFRLWAVPSYGEAAGFWARLGRWLGVRWRRAAASK